MNQAYTRFLLLSIQPNPLDITHIERVLKDCATANKAHDTYL